MDKEIISQYLYDEYTKEYSGVKEWGKPPYKEWLEQKLFEAQSKSQESDSLPCVSDSFLEVVKHAVNNNCDLADVSEWRFIANEKPDKEGVYQVFDFKGNIDSVVYGNSGFVGEPDGFFNGKKVKASEIIAFR